jgi:hypothetical protein
MLVVASEAQRLDQEVRTQQPGRTDEDVIGGFLRVESPQRHHRYRRGFNARDGSLVRRQAAASTFPVLWLYTWSAEPLYARLGWERVGLERDSDRNIEVVLMKRNLP